jgi:hypothetical protein
VAIQILNVSVYPVICQSSLEEHPMIPLNEMDSIVEYVSEIVLGHKDTFPEYSHKHHKDLQVHKHGSISLYSEEFCNYIPAIFKPNSQECLSPDKYSYQYYKEINPPPPKV